MRILHLADRLSEQGGADLHLRDLLGVQALRHRVTLAVGRVDGRAVAPPGVRLARVRGLASPVHSEAGLEALPELLAAADLVHLHNVMNPVAIARAVDTGRALATIQDHRVFCPGPGKTLPEGSACEAPMGPACAQCLPEPDYRSAMLQLTRARQRALAGARLIVLSRYMQGAIAAAGMGDSVVIPPWIAVSARPSRAGLGWTLAGRLVAHKAPLLALEGWRSAGSRHPLRVAGSGGQEPLLEGAERLGWLPRPRLRAALRESRALLFPARWQEPFGIVGVEALAEGTPVIAVVRGGMSDWADQGCLAVEPDPAGLAAAIRRLERDPAEAERLGAAGWAMVRERFSQERLWPRLESTMQEVAR